MDRHCTETAAKQGTRADPSPAIVRFEQRIKELDDDKRKAERVQKPTREEQIRTIDKRQKSPNNSMAAIIGQEKSEGAD